MRPEDIWIDTEVEKGVSDHEIPIFYFEVDGFLEVDNTKEEEVREVRLYSTAKVKEINERLQSSFENWKIAGLRVVELLTKNYLKLCNEVLDEYVPVKDVQESCDESYVDKAIKTGRRKCRKLYNQFRRDRNRLDPWRKTLTKGKMS